VCNGRFAGFGEFTDEADIAFWTGILGERETSNNGQSLTHETQWLLSS
jgi:hypothetical protein